MEICDFKIAKKLKEKGFREKVMYFYDRFGNDWRCLEPSNMNDTENCSAPTISQVLKWLREEKKIDAGATYDSEECKWIAYASEMNMPDLVGLHTLHTYYNSWEIASLAIIEFVLDNLI